MSNWILAILALTGMMTWLGIGRWILEEFVKWVEINGTKKQKELIESHKSKKALGWTMVFFWPLLLALLLACLGFVIGIAIIIIAMLIFLLGFVVACGLILLGVLVVVILVALGLAFIPGILYICFLYGLPAVLDILKTGVPYPHKPRKENEEKQPARN